MFIQISPDALCVVTTTSKSIKNLTMLTLNYKWTFKGNIQNISINFNRYRDSNISKVAQIMDQNFIVRSHLKYKPWRWLPKEILQSLLSKYQTRDDRWIQGEKGESTRKEETILASTVGSIISEHQLPTCLRSPYFLKEEILPVPVLFIIVGLPTFFFSWKTKMCMSCKAQ